MRKMDSDVDPTWLPKKREINNSEWDEFRRRFAAELGFDEEPNYRAELEHTQILEEANALTGNHNWHLWMPKDSITRMREAARPYGTFKNIVQETAENALGETDPNPLDFYFISGNVVSRFRGSSDFNVEDARTGDFNAPDRGNTVYDEMTIIVQSTNARNLQDWYVYNVENAEELFPDELCSMTEAAHLIYEAGLKPQQTLRNVAFTLRDGGMNAPSVSGVEPPDHSVLIIESDMSGSYSYYQIDSPTETFGDHWGDVDLMTQQLSNENIESIEGTVGFLIVAGVDW